MRIDSLIGPPRTLILKFYYLEVFHATELNSPQLSTTGKFKQLSRILYIAKAEQTDWLKTGLKQNVNMWLHMKEKKLCICLYIFISSYPIMIM